MLMVSTGGDLHVFHSLALERGNVLHHVLSCFKFSSKERVVYGMISGSRGAPLYSLSVSAWRRCNPSEASPATATPRSPQGSITGCRQQASLWASGGVISLSGINILNRARTLQSLRGARENRKSKLTGESERVRARLERRLEFTSLSQWISTVKHTVHRNAGCVLLEPISLSTVGCHTHIHTRADISVDQHLGCVYLIEVR